MPLNNKVLIISPLFPPANAADMQRVRMSLPYFAAHGWDAEVVMVHESYVDINLDALLLQSIPASIKIHKVKALKKQWTSKFGLGSIALRSLWFYRKKVNQLLKEKKFDLVYFSTTQFPVCILGPYWRKKFGIPYVIDMQDPWHSDYYQDKPKTQRPPKYWFSYRLNKYLEPIAMSKVCGLISVTEAYITDLRKRYTKLSSVPYSVITFGAFIPDFQIANENKVTSYIKKEKDKINIAYVGVAGSIMAKSLKVLFNALNHLKTNDHGLYQAFEWFFIGTSYAPKGTGKNSVIQIAKQFQVDECIHEQTNRIGYYEALRTIGDADGLLIIGSDEANYTASKTYPYIIAQKPLLAILHPGSSAINVIADCNAGEIIKLDDEFDESYSVLRSFLIKCIEKQNPETIWDAFKPRLAQNMAFQQCELFNKVVLNPP
jgi:hypothetical protein